MRIGELSRRTGVSVPTIKYYVREGLLPAGRLSSPNQASYDETHERRLRLIRALLDIGGLSVAGIREVLAAIDDPGQSVHKVLGEAVHLLVPRYEADPDAAMIAARAKVAALIERRGWEMDAEDSQSEALAAALAALDRVGYGSYAEAVLDDYADAAEKAARADLAYVGRSVAREDMVESSVVGTVLGEAMLAALRRMAHVDASARTYETE
ncbi:MerR family transcriptional regulator [Streptomyces sp. NPDC059909]|uniref:MerR family transcriptional regulator n=1 Tax=Streptomyces sp. NPDC059909 TaxID=3346998 RepID=UPI00364E9320